MSPRGVYDRKKRGRKPAAVEAVGSAPNGSGNGELASRVLADVASLADAIKSSHSRIAGTWTEIGKNFLAIKQLLDGVPAEVRRVHKVPSFTAWMRNGAPQQCGMSERMLWYYYRNYSEAIAAGLKPETITALSPTVLKKEKARKAVIAAISRNPILATQLNEAASKPGPKTSFRKIAESKEIQDIIKKVEAPPKSRAARVEAAVFSAYKPVFLAPGVDLNTANRALEELTGAIRNACGRLRLGSNITVTFAPLEVLGKPGVPSELGEIPADVLKQLTAAGYTYAPKAKAKAAAA